MKIPTQNFTILLAEDNIKAKNNFIRALNVSNLNYTLASATTSLELYKDLDIEDPARPIILFINLNLLRLHGYQYINAVRKDESFCNLAIAIYSENPASEQSEEVFLTGANVFFNIPDDIQKFGKMLEAIIIKSWQHKVLQFKNSTFIFKAGDNCTVIYQNPLKKIEIDNFESKLTA